MSEETRVRRLRRLYARDGLLVRKVPERSRWFQQYGPYMLVDAATNMVTAYGLDLDDLSD